MGDAEAKRQAMLEAALFMTERPLWLEDLEDILKMKKNDIEALITKLEEKYKSIDSGIELSRTGGFKLSVKPEFITKVSKLTRHADMSRGLLRVLSIIVHNEPVTQSDLVKKVGNRVYEYTKELENLGFIRTEKKSRTKSIYTTKLFEEYFGVKKEQIQGKKEDTKENQAKSGNNEAKPEQKQDKEVKDSQQKQEKKETPAKPAMANPVQSATKPVK